jgi:hypothetical protein
MPEQQGRWRRAAAGLLREPLVHFFILGVLLFVAHRLVVGNPRVIVVSAGLRADMERRFRDQIGRHPTPAELDKALDAWKRDEALYREALLQRIERDDPAVRMALVNNLHMRAIQEMPKHEPSDAELDQYLTLHRKDYELPLRYDFELVAFAKAEGSAEMLRSNYQRALAAGAKPRTLGRPIVSGTLTREDLTEKFGKPLAERICGLAPGQWQALEEKDSLLLVRVNGTEGGLPSRDLLRERLTYDWVNAMKQQAVDRMVEDVFRRYRVEERP